MSRVFALSWRSLVLVVYIAALQGTDARRTCRRCIGELFNVHWDHFVFNGSKPKLTSDCHLAKSLDTLPADEQIDCLSEVCIDYFVYNSLGDQGDPKLYSHVRDCAENLLGKPVPNPVGSLVNYCDFGTQEWCSSDVTNSPFNIVCGTTLVTYSSLCTTRTDKEPPCNNDYNYYQSCIQDPKTNPCFVCDQSPNAAECKNERHVNGKWCTTTTLRDNGAIIWVERGASSTNAYSNEGSLTRTINGQTYTIEYCSTSNCNSIYPRTGTSMTTAAPPLTGSTRRSTAAPPSTGSTSPSTAAPPSSGPTSPSTAAPPSSGPTQPATAPPTAPPLTESSTAPPPATTTKKLGSSIVASTLTVGVCAMLLTIFGH